jgi:YegS/Rv2252/BmrU family lipid kinase
VRAGIIWNPSKIEREVLEAGLADAAAAASIDEVRWWETAEEDPGQGVAAEAIAAGAQLLIVAGGDGTVRAVAEHLADTSADVELAIVPLGTGNLFARNLGLPLGDVPAAIDVALAGATRAIDVGWVELQRETGAERHAFVVMVGFGLDAQMLAETDDDLKDKAGWLAYVESLGRAWSASDMIRFTLATDDGMPHDREAHTFLVANCGTIQGGMRLLPGADPSDGELDYLVLSAEGVAQWLTTLKTMVWDNGLKGVFQRSDEVTDTDSARQGRAVTVAVTLPESLAFEIDGEEAGETRAFTVTIQPSAIRVKAEEDSD